MDGKTTIRNGDLLFPSLVASFLFDIFSFLEESNHDLGKKEKTEEFLQGSEDITRQSGSLRQR